MSKQLPSQCSLAFLKKDAQRLEKAIGAGESESFSRVRAHHPKYGSASDEAIRGPDFSWNDVLLVIAREYGFPSWIKIKEHVEGDQEADLSEAREILASILPPHLPSVPGLDIHAFERAAREVGGDYYDVLKLDEHRALFVRADISGKGLPGVTDMRGLRDALHEAVGAGASSTEALKKANREVYGWANDGRFITCQLLTYDTRTRRAIVNSAGAEPIMVCRKSDGRLEKIQPHGIALGFDEGPRFDRTIREAEVQLEPGDRVVFYSDGAYEQRPPGDKDAESGFHGLIRKHANLTSKEFIAELVRDFDELIGGAEKQLDDIALITFKVLE